MNAESPRWLVKMGRDDEAREILGRLRTENGDAESPRAVAEYEDIVVAVALEREHTKRNSYISTFLGRNDGNLHIARRVQLSIWLQIVQEYDVLSLVLSRFPGPDLILPCLFI